MSIVEIERKTDICQAPLPATVIHGVQHEHLGSVEIRVSGHRHAVHNPTIERIACDE